MNIGQQVVINSKKFAYKHYQGRMGVVVGYDEVKNEYFVWCNWTTLTIPADELTPLGDEVAVPSPKFSLPEVETVANSEPAPRKRGRPAKVQMHPMVPTPGEPNNFENEYKADYVTEYSKGPAEPETSLTEPESSEPNDN